MPPHPRQKSKIIHLPCFTLQLVTELGMGYAYELARPLPDAAAAQFRHTVLGYHAVYYVLEGGDRRARMELRHDARDRLLGSGRVQHNKRLAVLGEERPARKVRLASRRRPVLAAQRLGGTLAQEVDLEGGVDRDEAIFSRNVALVVGVVDWPELDAWILLHKLVQTLASQGVGRDRFVPVGALAVASDDASLDKVHEPVGEQLGVDPKLLVVAQQPEYLIRNGADPGLQRGAVGYALCDVPGDLAVGLL